MKRMWSWATIVIASFGLIPGVYSSVGFSNENLDSKSITRMAQVIQELEKLSQKINEQWEKGEELQANQTLQEYSRARKEFRALVKGLPKYEAKTDPALQKAYMKLPYQSAKCTEFVLSSLLGQKIPSKCISLLNLSKESEKGISKDKASRYTRDLAHYSSLLESAFSDFQTVALSAAQEDENSREVASDSVADTHGITPEGQLLPEPMVHAEHEGESAPVENPAQIPLDAMAPAPEEMMPKLFGPSVEQDPSQTELAAPVASPEISASLEQ